MGGGGGGGVQRVSGGGDLSLWRPNPKSRKRRVAAMQHALHSARPPIVAVVIGYICITNRPFGFIVPFISGVLPIIPNKCRNQVKYNP